MASTDIGYEQWHEGEGYDLAALTELEGGERDDAEAWLLARAGSDWRDLEGLLALGSPVARAAVVEQLRHGSVEQRLAAARRLPEDPAVEADREAAIVDGLAQATVMNGLTTALDLAVEHRTPAIIDALFRAALRDDREMAVHAAARLAFIHGAAKEEFDWDLRPLFLRFNTPDRAERADAFRDLCELCQVDPERSMRDWR